MNRILLIASTIFIVISLFGCQSEKSGMTISGTISEISISESGGFGGLNEDFIFSSNDKYITSNFEGILERSLLDNKKFNITKEKPDYDILIETENHNTNGLHLIFRDTEEEIYITYIGYEDKVFKVSPDDTGLIRELLSIWC